MTRKPSRSTTRSVARAFPMARCGCACISRWSRTSSPRMARWIARRRIARPPSIFRRSRCACCPTRSPAQAASLIAGEVRPVLTTDVVIAPDGELVEASIYPARIRISQRLNYDHADQILADPEFSGELADTLRQAQRRRESIARSASARGRAFHPAARGQGSRARRRHPDRGPRYRLAQPAAGRRIHGAEQLRRGRIRRRPSDPDHLSSAASDQRRLRRVSARACRSIPNITPGSASITMRNSARRFAAMPTWCCSAN